MQIKAMPVNMAQKRELKAKLKVCDKTASLKETIQVLLLCKMLSFTL